MYTMLKYTVHVSNSRQLFLCVLEGILVESEEFLLEIGRH